MAFCSGLPSCQAEFDKHTDFCMSVTKGQAEDRISLAFGSGRINWAEYTDREMQEVAILADRYGRVDVLAKVRRATQRRDATRSS